MISAAIAEARDKGDLSENAEYEAAREAQGLLELNIAKLQNLVANARVIDESQIGTDKVQMLNKVKVKNLNTNQIMNFTLVSEQEADFMSGKLAAKTPIGQALMGHGVGEVVEAKVLPASSSSKSSKSHCNLVIPDLIGDLIFNVLYVNNIHKNSQRRDPVIQGGGERGLLCFSRHSPDGERAYSRDSQECRR